MKERAMFTEMPPLTIAHVIISLIAIASGFVVLTGLINAKMLEGWTAIFLATTVLTSVSGFFLPAAHLMPSHIVGIISLIVLAAAIVARYLYHLRDGWRGTYVVSAMIAFYLNVFVLGRAVPLRESAVAQGARADANGSAIRSRAACRDDAVRGAYGRGESRVPRIWPGFVAAITKQPRPGVAWLRESAELMIAAHLHRGDESGKRSQITAFHPRSPPIVSMGR